MALDQWARCQSDTWVAGPQARCLRGVILHVSHVGAPDQKMCQKSVGSLDAEWFSVLRVSGVREPQTPAAPRRLAGTRRRRNSPATTLTQPCLLKGANLTQSTQLVTVAAWPQ
jgi:hypothetical protein